MKLILLAVLVLFAGVLIGGGPTYPINDIPVKLIITKKDVAKNSLDDADGPKLSSVEVELTKKTDISKMVEAMSPVWCRPLLLNSLEGLPVYYIEEHKENDIVEEHTFTVNEFGGRCSTPQHLMQIVNDFFNQ